MLERKKQPINDASLLVCSVFVLFVLVLIRSAWVSDDAYITLRTVDNLYHGFGLTWNPGERVQTYTHPLWMFLIATVYFLEDNPYFILIGLPIVLTVISVYLLVKKTSLTYQNSMIGILLLLSSKAFIDFSTSGLENPLTHLIYIIFATIFLNRSKERSSVFILALTTSFGMLSRMDTFLLFIPAIIYIVLENRSKREISFVILGFLPFILWELFSLFYYGFLFPNTAYAKLNTGISSSLLAKQGILYVINLLSRDPGSLFIIALGIYVSLKDKDWRKISLSIGMVLYLLYIIRIGGDFMSGRFFSILVIGAVIQIVSTEISMRNSSYVFATLVLFLIFIATPEPPIMYNAGDYNKELGTMSIYNGIEDERSWYYHMTGLLTIPRTDPMPRMSWAALGIEAKEREYSVIDKGPVGVFGYYAGPSVHVVDWYALGDPLLARLPVDNIKQWRIGHYFRSIPDGYLETLETKENHIVDPNLSEYYEKLSVVIKGDLLDSKRFVEIWKVNTGYYQPLLDAYLSNQANKE